MLKKQAQVFITILFTFDVIIIGVCWFLAYYVRFYFFTFPKLTYIPPIEIYLRACGVVMFLGAICLIYGKMYTPKRISSYRAEIKSIINSNIVLWIILVGLTFYYRTF